MWNNEIYKIFQIFSDDNMDAKLVIIDYEYCSYNYRAFDFANHFHEWMFDYTNKSYPFYFVDKDKFPSKEQRVSKYMCKIQTCIRIQLLYFCLLSITYHVFCMFWKCFNSSHASKTKVTSQRMSYICTHKTYIQLFFHSFFFLILVGISQNLPWRI